MSLIFQYRDAVSQVARLQADVDELRLGNSWLKQQRDELLKFAEWCLSEKFDSRDFDSKARAAIARVKPC